MKKEYKQFETPFSDAHIKDACEMSSTNFQEIYIERGYDPNKVQDAWYNARRTKKGNAYIGELYNKFPMRKKDPQRAVTVIVSKADQKMMADKLGQHVEASPVTGIRLSSNPKIEEARKHFKAGITRKQDLAAAMDISEGYSYKLLKALKNE